MCRINRNKLYSKNDQSQLVLTLGLRYFCFTLLILNLAFVCVEPVFSQSSYLDRKAEALSVNLNSNPDAALEKLRSAIKAASDEYGADSGIVADLNFELALLAQQSGRFDTAEQGFAEAARIKPSSAVYQVKLAEYLNSRGRTDDARSHLLGVLKKNPVSLEARQTLALTYMQDNNPTKAVQQFAGLVNTQIGSPVSAVTSTPALKPANPAPTKSAPSLLNRASSKADAMLKKQEEAKKAEQKKAEEEKLRKEKEALAREQRLKQAALLKQQQEKARQDRIKKDAAAKLAREKASRKVVPTKAETKPVELKAKAKSIDVKSSAKSLPKPAKGFVLPPPPPPVPNGWLVNGPGQATQGYNLKTEAKVKKKDDSKAKESKPADSTVAKEAPKEAKPKSSKKEDDDDFLLKW